LLLFFKKEDLLSIFFMKSKIKQVFFLKKRSKKLLFFILVPATDESPGDTPFRLPARLFFWVFS